MSGPFWYTVGAALNVALFPILSVHLKTRAPGAKTFLQVLHTSSSRIRTYIKVIAYNVFTLYHLRGVHEGSLKVYLNSLDFLRVLTYYLYFAHVIRRQQYTNI